MPVIPNALLELTDAALSADYTRVKRAVTLIARDLEKSGHESEAKELRAMIRKRGVPLRASGYVESLPVDSKSRMPLVEERSWPDTPIFLNSSAWHVFKDFIADVQHLDSLSKQGLSTRLGLLLSGPPGYGQDTFGGASSFPA